MKILFVGLLILDLVLAGSHCLYVNAAQKKKEPVPKDFSYPESSSITEVETPMFAKSLSGTVLASSGAKIPKALVELVNEGWKTRIDATFTDSEGSFGFPKAPLGKHFLKISMPGFDTLLITVIMTRKSRTTLRLYLNPST